MLHVTHQARTELHGILDRILDQRSDSDFAPEQALRLVARGARLGLALDSPRGGDEIVEQDGRSVLILDSAVSEFVENLTLDVVETPEGTQLWLHGLE
jgi:hypothetical protein